jgi:hypothetical protein
VVINLSNDVELGKKEAFMAPLDPLMDGARAKLRGFYESIVETFVEDVDAEVEIPAKLELSPELMQVVHSYLEEKHVLEELDESITNHVDLGLNQHAPLMLRQALSRCPPLVVRKSSGDDGIGRSSQPSPLPSPNHSPAIPRRTNRHPAPVLSTASASDVRSAASGPALAQRRWSATRSASAGVAEKQKEFEETRKSPRLLVPGSSRGSATPADEGRRSPGGHSPEAVSSTALAQSEEAEIRKSPRLLQGLQRILKKEPDHDSGYVSTIFSEEYDPDAVDS